MGFKEAENEEGDSEEGSIETDASKRFTLQPIK